MPGGDGTGPLGKGPGVGCRGGGRGASRFRGNGRGIGRCVRRASFSEEAGHGDEASLLEQQAKTLENEMQMVQERLKEIKGE
jgi:hypothetical protein